MTSVSQKDEAGSSFTTTADVSMADVETWRVAVANGTDKVVVALRGTKTRRKE